MPEQITVRVANVKKEYLETLTPLAWTNDFGKTFKATTDVDKVDYDWVKNNVLNTIEKIYLNGGLQSLIIWIYDTFDKDFCVITLTIDPGKTGIIMEARLDPTATISKDTRVAVDTIIGNLHAELPDIALRTISSAKTISATISSMASAVGATVPTGGTPATDIDRLCEEISKNTKAEVVKPKETLADYICNPLLKTELEEIKDFFEHSVTYKSAGVSIPKGILFKGPWGTGKTYAARCIAGTVDCFFMTCTASALQGQYIGSGAENIRMIFKAAKVLSEKSGKGVILFIDELDSFGDRQNRSGGAGGEEDRTLNQLLAEMSGFTESENIMVLAATNFPERLDSALMRSGRFGRQITIDYPDDFERLHMVKYYFDKIKMPLEAGVKHETISDLTKGLTPADIKEISNEAGILTIRQGKSEITLDNINEAVNKVITKNIRHPDGETEFIKLVTAHECGHVLAEVLYNDTIPIKVTNYSYGDAGGFTQTASVMTGLLSKEKFIDHIRMLLGGRVAEETICGYITNGASNDLAKAKAILKSYYKDYNLEPYETDKLEQIVLDRIHKIYEDLLDKFNVEENKNVLIKLIEQLSSKRVLYAEEIAPLVASIRKKVVF